MYWETLNFTKKPIKIDYGHYKCRYVSDTTTYPDFPKGHIFIGVDPGINYGITIINELETHVIWGSLPKMNPFHGLEAIEALDNVWADGRFYPISSNIEVVHAYVEGPAFGAQFGQTKLEQVRFGFVVGLHDITDDIKYVAPSHARKVAFGDGKKAGKNIWININENGADSIGVALACLFDTPLPIDK